MRMKFLNRSLLFFLGYDTCYESVGSRCHAGSHYLAHFVSLLWPDYFRLNPRKSNLCCFCRNVRLRKQPLRRVAEYSCRRTILSGTCQTKCNQTSQLNMVAHFGPNQKKKTIMIIYALFALSLGFFVTQLSIDHAWLVGNECKNKKNHTHTKKKHTTSKEEVTTIYLAASRCLVLNTRLFQTFLGNIFVQYVSALCANRCRRNVVTDSANTAWKSPWKGNVKLWDRNGEDIILVVTHSYG